MGMSDAAYWLSWGAWEVTLAFAAGHLITCFGLILQLRLFLHNSYGLLFFLFFLFQLAMSSLALLCSAFLRRTQTAVYLGFVIFIIGWVMQTVRTHYGCVLLLAYVLYCTWPLSLRMLRRKG